MPRGAKPGGRDRCIPGGALTWGDALVGAGVLSSHRRRSMHGYALHGTPLCMPSPFDACSRLDCFGLWNG